MKPSQAAALRSRASRCSTASGGFDSPYLVTTVVCVESAPPGAGRLSNAEATAQVKRWGSLPSRTPLRRCRDRRSKCRRSICLVPSSPNWCRPHDDFSVEGRLRRIRQLERAAEAWFPRLRTEGGGGQQKEHPYERCSGNTLRFWMRDTGLSAILHSSSNPKGLCPPAQGCEATSYPGKIRRSLATLRLECHNPFGLEDECKMQKSCVPSRTSKCPEHLSYGCSFC